MALSLFRFPTLTAVGLCAVLLCSSGVTRAQVQLPGTGPSSEAEIVTAARAAMAAGEWNTAWAQLDKAPSTDPVLRLRVEVALKQDRPAAALSAWKLLWERGTGAEALAQIATHSARQLVKATDPLVRIESERLLATAGEKEAVARLRRQAEDPAASPLERAAAAAALSASGDAGAAAQFASIAANVPERDRFNLIRLVPSLPDAAALKLLAPMLKSTRSDVRYGAVLAISDRRGPEVLKVLRGFLASAPEGAAKLAAMLALANQGDRQMLAEVGKIAEYFGDRERLEYARALLAAGDPQGNRHLGVVQNSDDEMLRLEAAALVAKAAPGTGRDLLVGALGHSNVWVRLRALELLRLAPPQPNAFAHLLVANEEWIRLRSAELVLSSPKPSAPRAARP